MGGTSRNEFRPRMHNDSKLPPEGERRRYVRANDAIGLHVQRLEDIPAAGEAQATPVVAESRVRRLNKYAIEGYADVRRNMPEVAAYIDELEERIRELLLQLDGDDIPVAPTHKVSLSAAGIRFSDKLLLHPGEFVGVSLTLFPSGRRIGTDARVVSANDDEQVSSAGVFSHRLDFVRMTDADRKIIDEHVQSLIRSRPSND